MKNKSSKKIFWPLGIAYSSCMLFITLLTLVGGIYCFIWTLCGQEQTGTLFLLKVDTPINRVIEAFIILITGCLCFYFAVFKLSYNYRIVFNNNYISYQKNKIGYSDILPAFKIDCSIISDVELKMEFFNFFALKTNTGKKYRIFITPFSRKQMLKILVTIKECGGQMDYEKLEKVIKEEYLFGKRNKDKKTKRMRKKNDGGEIKA